MTREVEVCDEKKYLRWTIWTMLYLQLRPNPYYFAGENAAIWQFPANALPITIWRIRTAFSLVKMGLISVFLWSDQEDRYLFILLILLAIPEVSNI